MGRTPAAWELEAGTGRKTYVHDGIDLDKDEIIKILTAPDARYVAIGDVWGRELVRNSRETDYDTAKPEGLLEMIIEAASEPGDIVLDFFLGSGTTAAVSLKLDRRIIGIEQLEGGIETLIPRLQSVVVEKEQSEEKLLKVRVYDSDGISESENWWGGTDFIYCEMMQYNQTHLDKIQEAHSSEELVDIWKDITANSFLNWYVDPTTPEEAVNEFAAIGQSENGLTKQKTLLAELLNKNQLYVNLSEIDDEDFSVSEEDKALNEQFYCNRDAG